MIIKQVVVIIYDPSENFYMKWGICGNTKNYPQAVSNPNTTYNGVNCCIKGGNKYCAQESYTNYCNTDCCFVVDFCQDETDYVPCKTIYNEN